MKHHNMLRQSSDSRKVSCIREFRHCSGPGPQLRAMVFRLTGSSGKERLRGNKEEKIGQRIQFGELWRVSGPCEAARVGASGGSLGTTCRRPEARRVVCAGP